MVKAFDGGLDQGNLDRIAGLGRALAAQRRSATWWAGLSASGIALSVLARMNVQEVLDEARLFSGADVWPMLIVLGTVSLGSTMLLWGAAREARQDLPAGPLAAALAFLCAYGLPIFGYWLLFAALHSRAAVALKKLGYEGSAAPAAIESWIENRRPQGSQRSYQAPSGPIMTSDVEGREVTLEQAMRKNPDFGAWIRALDLHLETVGDHRRHTDWEPQQLAYGYLERIPPNTFLQTPASRRRRLTTVLRR